MDANFFDGMRWNNDSLTIAASTGAMSRYFLRFEYFIAAACVVALATFGFHGFMGSRSYGYKAKLEEKRAKLEATNAELNTDHDIVLAKVMLMRPESVDPDLVEELARAQLGLAKTSDLVLVYQP